MNKPDLALVNAAVEQTGRCNQLVELSNMTKAAQNALQYNIQAIIQQLDEKDTIIDQLSEELKTWKALAAKDSPAYKEVEGLLEERRQEQEAMELLVMNLKEMNTEYSIDSLWIKVPNQLASLPRVIELQMSDDPEVPDQVWELSSVENDGTALYIRTDDE